MKLAIIVVGGRVVLAGWLVGRSGWMGGWVGWLIYLFIGGERGGGGCLWGNTSPAAEEVKGGEMVGMALGRFGAWFLRGGGGS